MATLFPGLRTRLSAASRVLFGAVPPPGVVAEKSAVQPEGEVAEVQLFNRLAIELILAAGDEPFAGNEAPGDVPVVRLARLATVATAVIAFVVKLVIGLRASPEIETAGLDISEHGEEAYISL